MATYNGARFLDEQLQSILNQTYQNLEIIIQDDGSTDETMDLLRRYEAKDTRIQVHQNPKNLGINANFYSLIKKSSGDYISISDQDDVWIHDKIEILLNGIGEASLIYTDSALIDGEGKELGVTLLGTLGHKAKDGKLLMNLFESNTISGHACLFTCDLKIRIQKAVAKGFGDYGVYDMMIATIASFENGLVYHTQPLTFHRIHSQNNCNNFGSERMGGNADITDVPCRMTLEKMKRRELPFWTRKRQRLIEKIQSANQRRLFLYHFFDGIFVGYRSPYLAARTSPEKINRSIFSMKFYKALLASGLGISKSEAIKLSSGRILFYLARFL